MSILDLPETLVLHILRFGANFNISTGQGFSFKRFVPIDIPMNIKFSPDHCFMQKEGTTCFNLKSVVCHDGNSLHSGHYTAFINAECKDKNIFVKCDDMKKPRFIEIAHGFPREVTSAAYILIYDKRNKDERCLF